MQKVEVIQTSLNWRLHKHIVVYPYCGRLAMKRNKLLMHANVNHGESEKPCSGIPQIPQIRCIKPELHILPCWPASSPCPCPSRLPESIHEALSSTRSPKQILNLSYLLHTIMDSCLEYLGFFVVASFFLRTSQRYNLHTVKFAQFKCTI